MRIISLTVILSVSVLLLGGSANMTPTLADADAPPVPKTTPTPNPIPEKKYGNRTMYSENGHGSPSPISDSTTHIVGNDTARLPPVGLAGKAKIDALLQDAETQIKGNHWDLAASDYRQILTISPQDKHALYGAAECAVSLGDARSAIGYYRAAIYTTYPAGNGATWGDGYQENDVTHLMQFALVLSQAGVSQEAVAVYNRAAGIFDYDQGHMRHLILIPLFGDGTGQEDYSPRMLAAMAYTAIGVEAYLNKTEALKDFQEAVALAPDAAAPHFFLGYHLWGSNNPDARAEFQKAVELGDDQTAAEAKDLLKVVR